MTRLQQILGGLLIVQLIVSVIVFWPSQKADAVDQQMFEGLEVENVQSILIEDAEGNSVELQRSGESWLLDGIGDFPTNGERIDLLLESISNISTSRLVTETKSSHKRLQVAEDDFERKISMRLDDGEEILFVGSAPASGTTHVRKGGEEQAYLTGEVNSWEIGSQARSWVDVVYLEIPTESISSFAFENAQGEYVFERQDVETWIYADVQEGEEFMQNNLTSMFSRLASVHLEDPLGSQEKPEYGLSEPLAVITLTANMNGQAEEIVLRVGAYDEETENYYFKSSTSDYYVKLSSYTVSEFIERDRTAFVEEIVEETEGTSQE